MRRGSDYSIVAGKIAEEALRQGLNINVVGIWNIRFTPVPIHAVVSERKKTDPVGSLWSSGLASAGQPSDMR